jgi:hypothetical protein
VWSEVIRGERNDSLTDGRVVESAGGPADGQLPGDLPRAHRWSQVLHFVLRNLRIIPYKDETVILFNFKLEIKGSSWIVKKALRP